MELPAIDMPHSSTKHSPTNINTYIRDVQTPITEEKRFAEYSKDQIDKANAIFPLKFNFKIDKDILILEEPYYFLQLELLFNPKLSDLYDFRKKNQRQKNISYVKNIQKRNISTKYTYKEMNDIYIYMYVYVYVLYKYY